MAIEHDAIPNADLHEPKGVNTASAGEVYVADGAGSGAWASPATNLSFTYAGVYSAESDGVTVASIGTTAKKFEAFSHNSPYNGITPDYTNHKLTVNSAGDYYIEFSLSFATSAAGSAGVYQFHVRVNDVEQHIAIHREMSGTGDTGSGNCHGILTLAANDVITVWVESDEVANTDSISVETSVLSAFLIKAS